MTLELTSLAVAVFAHSWKAMLLIAAIFVLRFFLGKKISPAWRFSLWLVVAVPLLVHVSPPSSWSIFHVVPTGSQLLDLAPSADTAQEVAAEITRTQPVGLPVAMLLFSSLWFGGCVVMTVIFARQIFACRRWIRRSRPVTCQRALEIFENCRRRMKVKTWLHVAEGPDITGPFLIGAIRPVLLLPEGMVESASKTQLQTVFLHELAHLKRWDVWTSWLMSALLVVHWFNPFLWLAVRRMNSDREEACDAMALKILNPQERLEYGRALLDIAERFLASRKAPGLVGISETLKQMAGRIAVVRQVGTWKWQWKLLAGGFFGLISLSILTDPPAPIKEISQACVQAYDCKPWPCLPCDPADCTSVLCDPCDPCDDPCEPCKPLECEDCCLPCEDWCED